MDRTCSCDWEKANKLVKLKINCNNNSLGQLDIRWKIEILKYGFGWIYTIFR
ncbi:hypothetical protein C943_02794 [Mariniradius saccharolyticus AK6]|uniref:Uncharacterized protein n=1 Tax=Mariniradius saccharolyticus AK6 TaxID=1239962 RepID=M7XQV2_9BACT|nr:hypothetical protein C943_02794 [Mariniradius saccharolyticus AK6]